MPVCKVTVNKTLIGGSGESWTNVYNVNALGPNDAASIGVTIREIERGLSLTCVQFPSVSARLASGGPSVSILSPGLTGDRTGDVNNVIPLFNTVRATLSDGQNRPEIKYLRGYLLEINVAGPNLTAELHTDLQGQYGTDIAGVLGICGPSGEPIVSCTIELPIQMRQIGWNRRSRPGMKRGWVPV